MVHVFPVWKKEKEKEKKEKEKEKRKKMEIVNTTAVGKQSDDIR